MEDISRELEREIARAKPAEHKRSRAKRVIIVDDFGGMKSGGYLRVLVKLLVVFSTVCALAAGGFYLLYADLAEKNRVLVKKAAALEKQHDTLVAEKEILMARLVISGKEPRIEAQSPDRKTGMKDEKEDLVGKEPDPKTAGIREKENSGPGAEVRSEPEPEKSSHERPGETPALNPEPTLLPETQTTEPDEGLQFKETLGDGEQKERVNRVTVEKFTITRDALDKHLLVGFDIRNVSEKPGGVSGRIFAVLKPENSGQEDWLVLPTVPLKDGFPTVPEKGQYFSIAHFKPVRFRVENGKLPESFTKAAVYIYNEQGTLISETFMDIHPVEADG